MIRLATLADVPRLVSMGRHFIGEVYPSDLAYNPAKIAEMAAGLIDSPDGDILVALGGIAEVVVGMLALTAYDHPMSGERVVTEVCWWVEPSHRGIGIRLFKAAEQWATQHGARVFQMIAPSPAVARFYEHLGFKAIETTYQRRVA